MTIADVLAIVDEVRPNTFDDNIKMGWLSEFDGRIFNELIMTHEHDLVDDGEGNMIEPTFTTYVDENQELIAPDTYADVYRGYLYAMMDFATGETERFNNSMIMFNTKYQEFCNWYNSTHLPIQTPVKKMI